MFMFIQDHKEKGQQKVIKINFKNLEAKFIGFSVNTFLRTIFHMDFITHTVMISVLFF